MKNLKDKVVVVTGAGSGIGRALAIQFAKEGAKLALNDFDADGLQETISVLNTKEVYYEVFDVAQKENFEKFAVNINDKFGKINIVVNNAGVALGKRNLLETEYEDFEWLMNINFWGSVYGTKAILPYLLKEDEASVVNISSVFGIAGIADQVPYCSSKFAIRGFTEALRMEMARKNVTVSSVHPGGIKTNIVKSSKGWNKEDNKDKLMKNMEKLFINTPEYAANIIIKGIKKKKEKILVGKDARVLNNTVWFFPVKYTNMLIKFVNKVKK